MRPSSPASPQRPGCVLSQLNDGGEPMKHEVFERNSLILLIGILVVVSVGGLVQIAPLFWVDSTIEKVQGMRPYSPLEQAGRDIYVREGCYGCHSQMIRTLRDEVERYGHYSLAAESMYDHPFQWGRSEPGPTSPASAASIPTNGRPST
jgi:cytochrome c oxidase cbb3-type subunit II